LRSPRPLLATYQTPGIVVDGAKFDGVDDSLLRGGGLTGAVDSKLGIASWWMFGGYSTIQSAKVLQIDLGGGVSGGLYSRAIGSSPAGPRVSFANAAGTVILDMRYAFSTASQWTHCAAAWDLANGIGQMYVSVRGLGLFEDTTLSGASTITNDTIDYTKADWAVGQVPPGAGTGFFTGSLANLYFAPGQFLDLSQVHNRRKFITADGRPAFLGSDGSRPTGTAPIVYLKLDDGEALANFATNRGTGGNFTLNGGGLTASVSSPSD
jgi:hypothetical protein